jgi:hypothetical protein
MERRVLLARRRKLEGLGCLLSRGIFVKEKLFGVIIELK